MGAIGEPYVSLSEIKEYLHGGKDTATIRFDSLLQDAIESVSAEINKECDRQFNRAEVASTREFDRIVRYRDRASRKDRYKVYVDDFWTKDDLVVQIDGQVVNDYKLEPLNGIVSGEPGWPYWKISHERLGLGSRVEVTAKWGWESVPSDIKEATKIQAAQTYRLKDAQFGIAGTSQWGHAMAIRDNSMANSKIKRYRRVAILFGGGY